MATRTDARFSTYSGAPSLQPSLAPTIDTAGNQSYTMSDRSQAANPSATTNVSSNGGAVPRSTPAARGGVPYTGRTRTDDHSTFYKADYAAASMSSMSSGSTGGGAGTAASGASSDPRTAEIRSWSGALARMRDERLDKQRYVMSRGKNEEVSMLALGAKVERALSRRMVGQDATFSSRSKKTPTQSTRAALDAEKSALREAEDEDDEDDDGRRAG